MKWKNLPYTTVFFITGTITEWQPLLLRPEPREVLLRDMEFYRNKYGCSILAYVIMPEHYHMVVQFEQPEHLHGWLHDFQMHTANEIAKWLKQTMQPSQLRVYERHANGKANLAIWKEQARAEPVKNEDALRAMITYIHENPVKREMIDDPSDWMWSSCRNYHLDDDSVFRVDRVEML